MDVLARVRWAVAAVCLASAGCGLGDDRAQVSTEPPPWELQELDGELGGDLSPLLATDGDQVVVLVVDEQGVLHGASAGPDGTFVDGAPGDVALSYPGLGGVVRADDRWLAVGAGRKAEDELLFDPRVLESVDGREWSEVETSGLDGPAEVRDIARTDDGFVAVGTLRTADDPGDGGFLPGVWISRDGEAWTQVEMPLDGAAEGSMYGVFSADGTVVASGRLDDRGLLWSSTDGGATWTAVESNALDGASSIGDVVANGDVLLVGVHRDTPELGEHGEYGEVSHVRSTDGGRSWSAAASPPVESSGYVEPVFAGAGWFFVAQPGGGQAQPYETEVCYADIHYCQNPPRKVGSIFASRDGTTWESVDTRGLGELSHLSAIGGTDDGRVIVLLPAAGRSEAWVWPAGEELAMRGADPIPPPPEGADVDLVTSEDELEVGHRYAMPMGGHCGYSFFFADDRAWQLVGEELYQGEYPEHWPAVGQQVIYGYVTLVDDDTLEYSIGEGEVIATFRPASEEYFGCA